MAPGIGVSRAPSFVIHCQAKVALVSPSSSSTASAEASSVSPTRADPEMAGRPVGAMLMSGSSTSSHTRTQST